MLETVVFIGRSGSGKGTQAKLLKDRITLLDSRKRPILYVETGEHFRAFIRGKSFSSKLSRTFLEKDLRQPDFLACFMWTNVLVNELGEEMHLVFDGAPRSLPEAVVFSSAMAFYKREKPTIIHINVSNKWSEERLLARSRSDDTSLDKITKRLDWFERDTLPAIDYFKAHEEFRFIEVDGEQSIENVHNDIIAGYEHTA